MLLPDASSVPPRLLEVLTASNKRDKDCFTPENMRLFDILASQTAQVIERARFYDEEREREELNQELVVAAEIQQRLVPISRRPGVRFPRPDSLLFGSSREVVIAERRRRYFLPRWHAHSTVTRLSSS